MPVWSKNEKCIFLLFLQFITKERMKTLIYMKFVYKYGRCISFYIVCIILKFENRNSLKSHRSLHINKYNHVPVMTAFKRRNRLIYTCTGEAERKRWNSSYEKLPNVNYAFHHLLSYLFTSE